MKPSSKAVLITGASSGIGAATAERLAAGGYKVYASARKLEAVAGLKSAGCETIAIDVTDETSMQAAVSVIEAREGAIGVLINNAGYSQSGALETLGIDAVRRQFETNVFGPLRLTQLALPGMRKAGSGRIVNISSMGGKLTFPGGGAYHASKYAVEALSDALRFEVKGFGIDVIVIEPGLIRTGFAEAAVNSMSRNGRDDVYAAFDAAVAKATTDVYGRGMLAKLGGGPDDVARAIQRALQAERPKARYRVTASAHMLVLLRALLSDWMWDGFVGQSFPQPAAAPRADTKR
jgi:NAD(P)-dependent dehydrogenase (short-subunit alcohol dehydrogenase family)